MMESVASVFPVKGSYSYFARALTYTGARAHTIKATADAFYVKLLTLFLTTTS